MVMFEFFDARFYVYYHHLTSQITARHRHHHTFSFSLFSSILLLLKLWLIAAPPQKQLRDPFNMREIDCVLYFVGFFLNYFLNTVWGQHKHEKSKTFFGRRKREYRAAMEAIVVVLFCHVYVFWLVGMGAPLTVYLCSALFCNGGSSKA